MNVINKQAEKITKYRDLEIEIQKYWNLKKVQTMPVVIGALGAICKRFIEYLNPYLIILSLTSSNGQPY